jgi:hypothetical protein
LIKNCKRFFCEPCNVLEKAFFGYEPYQKIFSSSMSMKYPVFYLQKSLSAKQKKKLCGGISRSVAYKTRTYFLLPGLEADGLTNYTAMGCPRRTRVEMTRHSRDAVPGP